MYQIFEWIGDIKEDVAYFEAQKEMIKTEIQDITIQEMGIKA